MSSLGDRRCRILTLSRLMSESFRGKFEDNQQLKVEVAKRLEGRESRLFPHNVHTETFTRPGLVSRSGCRGSIAEGKRSTGNEKRGRLTSLEVITCHPPKRLLVRVR
jgi:hypothetical protein